MTPNRNTPSPNTESSAPITSRWGASCFRDSGITRSPTTTPAATIGTFTRKTEPHQKRSSRIPPTTGPIVSPAAPKTANARSRALFLGRVEHRDDGERGRDDARGTDADERA